MQFLCQVVLLTKLRFVLMKSVMQRLCLGVFFPPAYERHPLIDDPALLCVIHRRRGIWHYQSRPSNLITLGTNPETERVHSSDTEETEILIGILAA